ncbi:hypothetical protein [Aeromonas enteropelogenes]|uniref:hypothetical protein n=1 Tax=Aeromonas enteropelogenes TaxID=29489 RepID=UPI003BA0DCDD
MDEDPASAIYAAGSITKVPEEYQRWWAAGPEKGEVTERKMVPEKGTKRNTHIKISKLTLCATDKKQIQEY